MCPSKVSGEVSFSLYYSVICSNCLGNVVIGMEKCGKMCENLENVENVLETRFLYTTYISFPDSYWGFLSIITISEDHHLNTIPQTLIKNLMYLQLITNTCIDCMASPFNSLFK